MTSTPRLSLITTKLERIARLARQIPEPLDNLAHNIDIDWLREACARTRKDGAPGVDGQTAAEYAVNLEANLQNLLDRAKSGNYRAPPVRRAEIPKGDGRETRPIGIPTYEDKILQRAVLMVLEAVYEQSFLDCSHGFRPRRSAHRALEALRDQTMGVHGGWVIDLDIRRFFDTLDRGHLREMLRRRVRDGVLLRLVDKWLRAGVLEEGTLLHPHTGTPQGGVISPLLANVYLHHVLDVWFAQEVLPRLKGAGFLVRYADDAVLVLRRKDDAEAVMTMLPERFGAYGLQLHPEKTRMVRFLRPEKPAVLDRSSDQNGTFDFLGFTHYWARSRNGHWVVKRKTASDRFSRSLRRANEWCRDHRHLPLPEQHLILGRKIQGHYAYYGITGNSPALSRFLHEVRRIWKNWLSRRSQRGYLDWPRFNRLLERYPLPPARAVHSIYRVANP